jgi:hypothetical protein
LRTRVTILAILFTVRITGRLGQEKAPHVLASLRNLAIGLMRIKGYTKIKEATEWIAENRDRVTCFMAT